MILVVFQANLHRTYFDNIFSATETVSICGNVTTGTNDTYISSDRYPETMLTDTDLNCTCRIYIGTHPEKTRVIYIHAVFLQLVGTSTDPCRERLTVKGKIFDKNTTVCPDEETGNATLQNQTFIIGSDSTDHVGYVRLNSSKAVDIHLQTNHTTSGNAGGKFQLHLQSRGRYTYTLK